MDKPLLMVLVSVLFPRLIAGTGGGGGVLLSCGFCLGAWWVGAGCCSDSMKAEMLVDKGGAIMYQTGKELPSSILAPKGDKSVDFENDGYDASGRFIQELEILVVF